MNPERLYFNLTRTMISRSKGSDEPGTFYGHAAVFNQRTAIGDPSSWGFWEEIDPHAFDRALNEDQDVRLLVDHVPSNILARSSSGTLRLSTDRRGLVTEADLAPTSLGRDMTVLLERGDVNQMSFGFEPVAFEWSETPNGEELIRLTDCDLFDVSIVTFPAYETTDAQMRSQVAEIRSTKPNPAARDRHAAARARFDMLRPPDGQTR